MKKVDQYIDFLLFEKGETVDINLLLRTALLTDAPKGADYYFDDKYIRTKDPVRTGDVVRYRNITWMLVSQVDKGEDSYQGKMRRCNHVTKFILDDWLYEFESIIEMANLSINKGGNLNIVTGNMNCTLQANTLTNSIGINQRFIASDAAWKVVGVDKTKTGLVILSCERDLKASDDDMENEIANKDSLPTWTIGLFAPVEAVSKGESVTATAVLYRNSSQYEDAEFVWHSADESIATVEDGVISGVDLGEATISVRWAKHPGIVYEFPILVEQEAPEVVTYKFYCCYPDGSYKTYTDFDILQGDTMIYGIEKYINGALALVNDTYTYVFTPNGASSTNYTFTVVDAYTCKLQNKKMYLTNPNNLKGTSTQSGEILNISILLKGAW